MTRIENIDAIRAKLRAGDVSVGSWLQIPHASVAEIMGRAGYDWVAVDLEHGAVALHQLPDLFRALELGGTLPLARVARADGKECKEALDAGAGGVILPMIENAEQLAAACSACRWPPAGARGVGFSRANLFGKHFSDYSREAQSPLVIAMIENARALEDLERIVEVPGVDAVLVGPYDLSASLGVTARFDDPRFEAAMESIRATCRAKATPCGLHVVDPDPAALAERINQGYRFIAYSIDAVFLFRAAERPVVRYPSPIREKS
jgi:2-dehydro-3-deoxyglucarate aldolase